MTTPTIGLLGLYLALYDEALPEARADMDAFYATIADVLKERGIAVQTAPICRVQSEVEQAVNDFEAAPVDAIVTLHLAYSPSLESVDVLARSPRPLIVLDTTPTYDFGPSQDPNAIMNNHGIHGVQDMCNLLVRLGKAFQIEAGHWERSDVLDRVARWARAAKMATRMRTARVGRIGKPFPGMGDFAVPADTLSRTIGVTTVLSSPEALGGYLPLPDAPEVLEELAADQIRFDCSAVSPDAHRESVRTGIALRRWMETERLTGFSVNFLDCDLACGLTTMPFLEADKAMARGTGYAGEGDVLTAALVGALAAIYPQTTFTEMFCPDWAANRIFVSHMGEVNSDLIVGTPILKEKPFPWTDVAAPVCPVGCLKRGEAILVNLAPGSSDTYTLILAPVTMLEGGPDDRMGDTVHGWLSPTLPIDEFLAGYSRLGGTHHCALVYGEVLATLVGFGTLMGWKISVIGGEG